MKIIKTTLTRIDLEPGDETGELYDFLGHYLSDAVVSGFLEIEEEFDD